MAQSPKLDRIDIKILTALHEDGRITNAALSELVGLSPSPCLQRVKRMEESGLIAGYQAEIDVHRLADTITVFTEVTIADHRREDFATFKKGIAQFPEVVECHLISGGYDYLLKFVSRSVSDYQSSIERLLDAQIGIEKYFSYIVIKSPIAGRKPELSNIVGIE
ncbi:MAG: Lrp/AsnC family transcriptional regulator [Pseudomonadota bacterium]|nr:Lrp/AsnC family transcriptional regulator [Pseudomonadota bacterium]